MRNKPMLELSVTFDFFSSLIGKIVLHNSRNVVMFKVMSELRHFFKILYSKRLIFWILGHFL